MESISCRKIGIFFGFLTTTVSFAGAYTIFVAGPSYMSGRVDGLICNNLSDVVHRKFADECVEIFPSIEQKRAFGKTQKIPMPFGDIDKALHNAELRNQMAIQLAEDIACGILAMKDLMNTEKQNSYSFNIVTYGAGYNIFLLAMIYLIEHVRFFSGHAKRGTTVILDDLKSFHFYVIDEPKWSEKFLDNCLKHGNMFSHHSDCISLWEEFVDYMHDRIGFEKNDRHVKRHTGAKSVVKGQEPMRIIDQGVEQINLEGDDVVVGDSAADDDGVPSVHESGAQSFYERAYAIADFLNETKIITTVTQLSQSIPAASQKKAGRNKQSNTGNEIACFLMGIGAAALIL
jgi:hypothetical protein